MADSSQGETAIAVIASTAGYVAVAASTTGGTAPGGVTAPTGCTLSSGTDISTWVTQIEVGADIATLDTTTFGSGGFVAMVPGLKSGVMNLNILQDWAGSAPNALLGMNGSVIAVGSTGFIEIKPTSGSRSTTNPSFMAKIINNGWRTLNATVGGLSVIQWNVQITGGFAELTA